MDDLKSGSRDKRDNWTPNACLEIAPFWTGKFERLGAWFVGYLWPWNAFHMVTALLYWFYIIPDVQTMRHLAWGWALFLFAVNAAGIFVMYGAVEFFYYIRRKQGTRFKYNGKFPADHPSEVFWFKSQNLDNFLRTYLSSVPLWTLCQVLALWAFANGWGNWVDWRTHWVWLVLLTLLVPAIHEVHFFCIHRLIHTPLLYKWVHSVHHNSINPSPWSSLSMHPVEGFLYFAEVFWHLIIPSHPIVMMFQLNATAYGAINGHIGFDTLEIAGDVPLESHAYAHYLHHKYFEVNYGADGLIPLDKWLGSWHDGSKEADELMKERFRKKKERMKAKSQITTPAQ
ncbi:MAG: sterol desaturase family protein [Hyphomicrobiales bacterium]|nr:sterol desaturase family protein [Hyphomicrobiales bacterium]MDE2115322.1 sterol desaturase family protein [Hyphomicrobiales bacterium]